MSGRYLRALNRLMEKPEDLELERLRVALERFIELHSPRTPAQGRRYAEDERGWNMMLGHAVLEALKLCPRDVTYCDVCEGTGLITCECGDPEHACGGGEEVVCGACDGDGEYPPIADRDIPSKTVDSDGEKGPC